MIDSMRYLAFLLVGGAFPALAQAPVSAGPAGQVEISAAICQSLGADADYRAGVDVNGTTVAPADLPGSSTLGLAQSPIEINSRFAGRFGVPVGGAYSAKAILGYVTVRDGHAFFNGAPLDGDADAAIIAACHARKYGPPRGQGADASLKSPAPED